METQEVIEVQRVPEVAWWSMTNPQVKEKLNTSAETGLSSEEATARIEKYGYKPVSLKKGLKDYQSWLCGQT